MGSTRGHWEDVYATKPETAVSWYQPRADRSLAYIAAAAGPASPIVDIGGGASTLVDDLLSAGYVDLTVLDVAEAPFARSKARLGDKAAKVAWIVADVTQWQPRRCYEVWHDRAVFHFLTESAQQDAYIATLKAGTRRGSTAIFATFAADGPQKCSGLPVRRYSPQTLAACLGPSFALVDEAYETHRTPSGTEQRFCYAVLRRVAD